MARLRFDAVRGELSAPIGTTDTVISSPGLARLGTVSSPDVALVCIYATDSNGNITNAENVYITSHVSAATSATVTRAGDGTTAQAWSPGTAWTHGWGVADVADVQSLITAETNRAVSAETSLSGSITGVQTNLTSEVTRATTAEAALAPIDNPTFTTKITTPAASVTGFAGAMTPTRYVGGVTGAAPTTGVYQTGDYVVDVTGEIWVCTAGGTPGNWSSIGSGTDTTIAGSYLVGPAPSGDTTGATDLTNLTTAINLLSSSYGAGPCELLLQSGVYYIKGSLTIKSGQSLIAPYNGTTINCVDPGDGSMALQPYIKHVDPYNATPGGKISGFLLNGSNAAKGSIGYRHGDMTGAQIDVTVYGFGGWSKSTATITASGGQTVTIGGTAYTGCTHDYRYLPIYTSSAAYSMLGQTITGTGISGGLVVVGVVVGQYVIPGYSSMALSGTTATTPSISGTFKTQIGAVRIDSSVTTASGAATIADTNATANDIFQFIGFKSGISALSATTTTMTVTGINFNFAVGQKVVISGCTPSAYNGTYTVATISGTTSLTITGSFTAGSASVTGTITDGIPAESVIIGVNPGVGYTIGTPSVGFQFKNALASGGGVQDALVRLDTVNNHEHIVVDGSNLSAQKMKMDWVADMSEHQHGFVLRNAADVEQWDLTVHGGGRTNSYSNAGYYFMAFDGQCYFQNSFLDWYLEIDGIYDTSGFSQVVTNGSSATLTYNNYVGPSKPAPGQYVYLTGFTGSLAALNNTVQLITASSSTTMTVASSISAGTYTTGIGTMVSIYSGPMPAYTNANTHTWGTWINSNPNSIGYKTSAQLSGTSISTLSTTGASTHVGLTSNVFANGPTSTIPTWVNIGSQPLNYTSYLNVVNNYPSAGLGLLYGSATAGTVMTNNSTGTFTQPGLLTAGQTYTFAPSGASGLGTATCLTFRLMVTQAASGTAATIGTWTLNNLTWDEGTAPQVNSTYGSITVFEFYTKDGGTTWRGRCLTPQSSSGVSSFNTRTGVVTLTKADVTGTGLTYTDVGADASGAASTAQTAAQTYADRYAGSAAGTASRPLAATDSTVTNSRTPTSHAATHAAAGTDPVAIAESQVTGLTTDLAAKAPLASPAFTGSPTAPTQTAGDNSTKLATTAFVANAQQPTTFIGSMITTASVSASGTVFPISPATYPISSGQVGFFNPSVPLNTSPLTLAGPVAVGATSVTVVSALGVTGPAGTEIVPYGAVLPLSTMFPNATVFEFEMMSGGAGGSSGCTGTASAAYAGGPGGGAGALAKAIVLSASTATVTVGYGGPGGSSAASSGHAGGVGSNGAITSVIANGVTYQATTGAGVTNGSNPGAAPAANATAVSGGGLWMSGALVPNSTTLSLLPGCGGNTGANGSPVPSAWTPGGATAVSSGGGGGGNASSTKGGGGGTGGGVTSSGLAGFAGTSSTVNGVAGTNGGTNTGSGGGGGGGGAQTTGTSGAGGWGGTGYIIIRAT